MNTYLRTYEQLLPEDIQPFHDPMDRDVDIYPTKPWTVEGAALYVAALEKLGMNRQQIRKELEKDCPEAIAQGALFRMAVRS